MPSISLVEGDDQQVDLRTLVQVAIHACAHTEIKKVNANLSLRDIRLGND